MALNFKPHLYIPSINNIESTLYTLLWYVLITSSKNELSKSALLHETPVFHPLFHSWWDIFCSQTKVVPPQITMDKKHGKITE